MSSTKLLQLQKIIAAQRVGAETMSKRQEESLTQQLLKALVERVELAKGDKGDKPIAGIDFPIPKDGEDGYTPKKGVDYFDGEDGYTPKKGVDYFDGKDGEDADMSIVQPIAEKEAESAIKDHKKEFDHKLIHDSKILGKLELNEESLFEGAILQVKGNKLVAIELPDASRKINELRNWTASQGVSNVRSFTVTANTELDAMGIYVIDASAGNITITVPSAAGRENHWFELIRIDSSENTVTLTPTGSETMSGMTTYQMSQWTDIKIFAYNGNYLIRQAT